MTGTVLFSEKLLAVFTPGPRGVVGLVDDLLAACRDNKVRLDFQDGYCRITSLSSGGRDAIEIPLQKSVFRAILARVAALCNERVPNSVTPYRGVGELVALTDPPATFRVSFINNPDEQHLKVVHIGTGDVTGDT
ncbi:hypothetical protein [Fimbriiglobus ruber]|uniref:Uncharacterized protein n=1 Tax=Fimbriiglobus ruber TaxID=1908690 RepID=A0A225DEE2_9BACT|nr:hypothetical protein [Fimbriiglobus ruber]OWK38014.1 hypothetical protein FRUB_07134 [Fimbriiglobus ruber]